MSDTGDTGDTTFSAGEVGEAVDIDGASHDAGVVEVVIGEIPDAHHLSRMLWTARCSIPSHGLLGTFENREDAENAKQAHLLTGHGGVQLH